jgi:hypothetical protein
MAPSEKKHASCASFALVVVLAALATAPSATTATCITGSDDGLLMINDTSLNISGKTYRPLMMMTTNNGWQYVCDDEILTGDDYIINDYISNGYYLENHGDIKTALEKQLKFPLKVAGWSRDLADVLYEFWEPYGNVGNGRPSMKFTDCTTGAASIQQACDWYYSEGYCSFREFLLISFDDESKNDCAAAPKPTTTTAPNTTTTARDAPMDVGAIVAIILAVIAAVVLAVVALVQLRCWPTET